MLTEMPKEYEVTFADMAIYNAWVNRKQNLED